MKVVFCIILLCGSGSAYPQGHYQEQHYEPRRAIATLNAFQRFSPNQGLQTQVPTKRLNDDDLDITSILEKSDSNWSPDFVEMLQNMKEEGRSIKVNSDQDDMNLAQSPNSVICKMEPYNTCYHVAPNGDILLSLVRQRPMRLLRIY
ncbi:uncharacterized protein [Lepeophtheirus salmonis]|uniref:uncharacterized protein n=1 Tax=Lepeophtheirus salmonis TaxID=72036 RepID=UPI001AE7970D|nr:uncharacterized protein LOC121129226 [Lepeophtheirus salmonis]